MKMRYKIEIGKKPRGRWLPAITLSVWYEGENDLNIDLSFQMPMWYPKGLICDRLSREGLIAPFGLSGKSEKKIADCIYKSSMTCDSCKKFTGNQPFNVVKKRLEFNSHVESRPGARPDYSDVVRWLEENIFKPLIEEFNRRIAEAETFGESEPITVDGNSESFLAVRQQEAAPKMRRIQI